MGRVGGGGGDKQRNAQVNAHAFVKTTRSQTTLSSVYVCRTLKST